MIRASLLLALLAAGCDSGSTNIVRVQTEKKPPRDACEIEFEKCAWHCRLIANERGQQACRNDCFDAYQKCKKRRGR